jgi:hypothetical protein
LVLTFPPPSLLLTIRLGSFGSIQRSWLSPCGTRIVENVLPASVDL